MMRNISQRTKKICEMTAKKLAYRSQPGPNYCAACRNHVFDNSRGKRVSNDSSLMLML